MLLPQLLLEGHWSLPLPLRLLLLLGQLPLPWQAQPIGTRSWPPPATAGHPHQRVAGTMLLLPPLGCSQGVYILQPLSTSMHSCMRSDKAQNALGNVPLTHTFCSSMPCKTSG